MAKTKTSNLNSTKNNLFENFSRCVGKFRKNCGRAISEAAASIQQYSRSKPYCLNEQ